MAKINGISFPGITLQKDFRGNVTDIKINIKRCSTEIKNYLKEMGLIKEKTLYNPEFVEKILKRENEESIPFNRIEDLWNYNTKKE